MSDDPPQTRANRDDEARATFAYLVTHALDKVVGLVVGPLDHLRLTASEHPLSADQEHLLDLASAATDQLVRLCNDMAILDLAASRDLEAIPERLPLTTLIRKAITQAQTPERSQAHREITLRLSNALPTLWCDVALTRRALAVLIENALRFSPPDTPITVETHKRGGWAVIRVRDSGAGVPPDQAEAIFAPLRLGQQRRNDAGAGLGIGLGLAVARACIAAQGGRLTLEPANGAGATFRIELPINPSEETARSSG